MTMTHTTGLDVAHSLESAGYTRRTAAAIGEAVNQLQAYEADLISTGRDITRAVTATNERLARGQHLNGLGELQTLGPRYDRLCALRQAQAEHIVQLVRALQLKDVDATYVGDVMERRA